MIIYPYRLLIPTIDDSWFPCEKKTDRHFAARDLRHPPRRTGKACPLHGLKTSQHRQHREVRKSPGSLWRCHRKNTMGLETFYPWFHGYFFMIWQNQNYLSHWNSWDRMRWYGMSPVVLGWYTTTTMLHLASLFHNVLGKLDSELHGAPHFSYGIWILSDSSYSLPRKYRRPYLGCTSINPRSAGIWP